MASRILLADDSITIQKVVNLTFADEGIEVVAVSNGEMAEKRLSEINPDLVLADIFMPGKNGYELCEFIKQSPQFSDVPVVLLVGAFEPFDQAEARRVKADTHLTKPFESRVLVETVRRLIKPRPVTGPLGSAAPASTAPPVEERPPAEQPIETRSMASPLLNIDLNAMSGPAYPGETSQLDPSAITTAAGFETLNETSPLDLDYASFMQDAGVEDQPQAVRLQVPEEGYMQTQQLASLSAQEQADILAIQQAETSVLVEEEVPEPAHEEWPDAPKGKPSAFGYSPQEVLLDFDQQQLPATPVPENVVSFDLDVSAPVAEQTATAGTEEKIDELDTGKLERPAKESDQARAADGGGEESGESEADYRQTMGPATSLLLAADNPFDVLFDERQQEAGAQAESRADAGEEWETMDPLSPVGEYSTLEMESEASAAPSAADEREAESAAPQMVAGEEQDYSPEPSVENPEPQAVEWEVVSEPSESGFEVSTVESAEPPQEYEPPAEPALSNEIDDEKLSAAMWSEDEARFTPIDIEAVAVSEPAPPEPSPEPSEVEATPHETGFEFQPVVEEMAAPEAAAAATELSPETIDEIVRRVVAQMSDRVVREIAWEVVPDAVERIIKEMARDSLPDNRA